MLPAPRRSSLPVARRGLLLAALVILVTTACDPIWVRDPDQDCDGLDITQGDCNDHDANIYPGAKEVPYDGIDQDCDGADLVDADGDGVVGMSAGGADCADDDAAIYPGAAEVCDGKANGCDGFVDDIDHDGQKGEACGGYDCNDAEPTVYWKAEEVPYDGIDQDCLGGDLVDVDRDGEAAVVAGGRDCDDEDPYVGPAQEVYIAAGAFTMGCHDTDDPQNPGDVADPNCNADEKPQHTVYLSGYCIDVQEITNAQYRACTAAGCATPETGASASRSDYYENHTWDDYPVVNVSWDMAQAYCQAQGKELPTEAQWEKAARGGACLDGDAACQVPNEDATRLYPWGEDEPGCTLANFDAGAENSSCLGEGIDADTDLVSGRPDGRSPYGMLNMAGNVAEWVRDYYGEDYYVGSPANDPTGPEAGATRVYRGGSYANKSSGLRAAKRSSIGQGNHESFLGFRCARPIPAR